MLKLYETFQQFIVPETLKNEILNEQGKSLEAIDDFSKINIFIGANNSGKSKIIREFIKQVPVPYHGKKNWDVISTLVNDIFSKVEEHIKKVINEIITYSGDYTLKNGSRILLDTQHLAN